MRECLDEGILQSYFDGELSSELAESAASHMASCVACTQAANELESESLLLSEALEAEFALIVPSERLRQRVDAAIAGLSFDAKQETAASTVGGAPAVSVVQRWIQSIAELFTLSPPRALGYAGLAAVILLASVIGGLYWNQSGRGNSNTVARDNNRNAGPTVPPARIESTGNPGIVPVPVATPTRQPIASAPGNRRSRTTNGPAPAAIARVKLLPGERSYLKTIASLNATIESENNRQMKASLQVEYQRNLAMVDQAIAATRSAAKVNPSDPDAAEFMFAAYQSKIDLLSQVADSRLSNRQH